MYYALGFGLLLVALGFLFKYQDRRLTQQMIEGNNVG